MDTFGEVDGAALDPWAEMSTDAFLEDWDNDLDGDYDDWRARYAVPAG